MSNYAGSLQSTLYNLLLGGVVRGLSGVVELPLPMARRVRVPYTTYRAVTLDKLLTSHCL